MLLGLASHGLLGVVAGLVARKVKIQHDQQDEAQDAPDDDVLHVLHPEFVLQLAGLLFELRCPVLEGVSSLVQLGQLRVPLEDLLHVALHDAHDLVNLGLLLSHPPLRHDLLHLLRSGQGAAVRPDGATIGGGGGGRGAASGRWSRHVGELKVDIAHCRRDFQERERKEKRL